MDWLTMIKALRKRTRPDNLVNQVRAGGKSMARRLYMVALVSAGVVLVSALIGPLIFLDADGLVMKERSVISSDYNARVTQTHVRPGDEVKVGQLLISVTSSETLDRIADFTAKVAAANARETQLKSRLTQISTLRPVAIDRRQRATASLRHLQNLQSRQLTTAPRVMEATREAYDAEREEAQMTGELEVIKQEMGAAVGTRKDLADALDQLKKAYNGGQIVAPADGTIGPKVPSSGSIIRVGETAIDLYRGATYVVGYLQTSRMFSVEAGDSVIVTDGKLRSSGTVIRLEAVADALPPEFQSVFSARERQQVIRVEMDTRREGDFPIHGKVKVTGLFTPTNLTSMLKTAIAFVTNTALRIAGLEPEIEPSSMIAGTRFADPISVGSVKRATDLADEDQAFPGEPTLPRALPGSSRTLQADGFKPAR
jgi:multidrug resistance efflux pump